MKICIYGAGAIGGFLGAELARTGCDVTLIARGAHLEAMRRDGLTLLMGEERRIGRVRCTADPAEAGVQDYIILALKAHSFAPVVGQLAPLLGPHTAVVTAQNGILWWYLQVVTGHPRHPLRERAQLLVTNLLLAQQDHRSARAELENLLADVPDGEGTPEALLRLGVCERALGDVAGARPRWEGVVREYPGSPAAREARDLLRAVGR